MTAAISDLTCVRHQALTLTSLSLRNETVAKTIFATVSPLQAGFFRNECDFEFIPGFGTYFPSRDFLWVAYIHTQPSLTHPHGARIFDARREQKALSRFCSPSMHTAIKCGELLPRPGPYVDVHEPSALQGFAH